MTESKWKEERKRRIKTENRLRLAEDSLKRLDRVCMSVCMCVCPYVSVSSFVCVCLCV